MCTFKDLPVPPPRPRLGVPVLRSQRGRRGRDGWEVEVSSPVVRSRVYPSGGVEWSVLVPSPRGPRSTRAASSTGTIPYTDTAPASTSTTVMPTGLGPSRRDTSSLPTPSSVPNPRSLRSTVLIVPLFPLILTVRPVSDGPSPGAPGVPETRCLVNPSPLRSGGRTESGTDREEGGKGIRRETTIVINYY